MLDPAWVEALRRAGLEPRLDEPLHRHGYWRIGGPADGLVEVPDEERLLAVMAIGAPVTVLGNGSNSLISDRGVRGLTVRLGGRLRESQLEGDTLTAGGGLLNAVLLRRAEQAGVGGLASLAGVPGTVGGAVRMNAGTALGEIGPAVISVRVALPGGAVCELSPSELRFAYRRATLPPGAIVISARLRVCREGVAEEQAAVRHHLERRKATQPLDLPSCGSVFKNPPGHHAGALIERVGLKGHVQGGAAISERHANFIVNQGGATAMDVLTLIRLAQARVQGEEGVRLEPEVHAMGDWAPAEWPP